jgi:multiple sugar transport system permease protein
VAAFASPWVDALRRFGRRTGSRRRRARPVQLAVTALLCVVAVIFVYPIVWLADSAFRLAVDIFLVPPLLLSDPGAAIQGYTLSPMRQAFGRWGVGQAYVISVVVTVASVALTLLVCSLCAYAFAFLRFRGRDVLFVALLGLMMLPMATMIVPLVTTVRVLHLVDSLAGLILPYALSPMGVFLLRQYYIRIPRDLFEAARIDGAGHWVIWWRIVVPISRPALVALATFSFLFTWNDFMLPALILRSERLTPLPLRVAIMRSIPYNPPYEALMAAGFLAAVLPLLFFLRYQRKLIEGLVGTIPH